MSATLILALAAAVSQSAALEIRTCPDRVVHSYPLDTTRGVHSLVLPGITITNTGAVPVKLDQVEVALIRGDEAVDRRTIASGDLAKAAQGTQAIAASGMLEAYGFQFCDGRLFGNAKPASSADLQPGEAVMLSNQTFAWAGKRDGVRISAHGASHTVPIGDAAAPAIRWPLPKGNWYVPNAPSLHTAHRWALPEQFALDIVKVDKGGLTHRGNGEKLTDYHAFGSPVLAVADGTIAAVYHARREEAPLIRRPDETGDAYLKRIIEAQNMRLMGGPDMLLGEAVVMKIAEDVYAVYAHLSPGSVRAKVGDVVKVGTRLGTLGNTGNTTEPHLHFQLCDKPSGLACAGIPMAFSDAEVMFADEPRPIQSGDFVVKR